MSIELYRKEKFIRYFINKVSYFGNYPISYTEGEYTSIKYRLKFLTEDILIVLNKIKRFILNPTKLEPAKNLKAKDKILLTLVGRVLPVITII